MDNEVVISNPIDKAIIKSFDKADKGILERKAIIKLAKQETNEKEPKIAKTIESVINQKTKYKYEIIADAATKSVMFNIWDIEANPTYPVSAIRRNMDLTETVYPFHVTIDANHAADQYVAQAYFYNLKIEYKSVGGV